jgi:drug/metabolite transporter (DMT)-like permease
MPVLHGAWFRGDWSRWSVDATAEDDRDRRLVVGRRCIVVAAVLWSLSGVLTRTLGTLDGPTIAFYRGLFAGLAFLPIVPRRSRIFRPAMAPLPFLFGALTAFYITAVTMTTAANAIFVQYSSPLFMIPISYFLLGEKPNRRNIMGSLVAGAGIVVIVALNRGQGGPNDRLGILLSLASGGCYAMVAVMLRSLKDIDPRWLSVVNNLGGAIVLGAGILAFRGSIVVPTAGQLAMLFGFGIVQMAIPYALFAKGLRVVPAPEAGLISLIEPILNPMWVFLAVAEVPEEATLYGGALLLAGVALRYLPFKRSKR